MADSLPPIIIRVETVAPPDETWAALTEPDRVAEWFTEATPVGREGDPYRLDFGDDSAVEGTVRVFEPGHRFAYDWSWTGSEPSERTLVSWAVEPIDGGGSRITLVHEGWAEAGANAATRGDHEGYWAGYLDDLVAILAERS